MADLSRVLQALGAILQGGGGTLTAIDEQKRQREKDEQNRAYMDSVMQSMSDARGEREMRLAGEGWQPTPEGGLPPLAPQGAPGPRGLPMGVQQPTDTRIQAGGMFRDTAQPSPNETMASLQSRREIERVGQQFLTAIADDPRYLALPPEEQRSLAKLVTTGVIDGKGGLDRLDDADARRRAEAMQDFYFVGAQKLARDMGMPEPPQADGKAIPDFNYQGFYNVLYNGQLQQRLSRLTGGGGGGMTANQSFDRTVTAASGEALILALEGKSIQQIASELATKGFGSLEQGIRIQIARDVFESVREEGDMGTLMDLNPVTNPRRSFNVPGTPGGGSQSRALQGLAGGGGEGGGTNMNRTLGQDLMSAGRAAGRVIDRIRPPTYDPLRDK